MFPFLGVSLGNTQQESGNIISFDEYIKVETLEGDERTGAEIVLKALESPIRQIAENSGVDGGVIIYNIENKNTKNYGYDALHEKYVDMIKAGIVDPTKVTRSAIQNATSVAGTLLTTESLIAEIKDKNQSQNNGQNGY